MQLGDPESPSLHLATKAAFAAWDQYIASREGRHGISLDPFQDAGRADKFLNKPSRAAAKAVVCALPVARQSRRKLT